MNEKIHIYHTNDLHSHFENWPLIKEYLLNQKALHKRQGEEVFLFDIGDFADRWHPYTEGTMGKGNVELLNEVGYNAVTIGNNEGITLPHDGLDTLYADAEFDVIAANLYKPGHIRPEWSIPSKIYETKNGTKIGVTGVTTYYRKLYELLGWELAEPFTELEIQLNRLKKEADIIIVLSHLGIHDDEKIASQFPFVDLILGGHTHHVLSSGMRTGTTMLAAAGRYGEYVGEIDLTYNTDTGRLTGIQAIAVETATLSAIPGEREFVKGMKARGEELLHVHIADIPEQLNMSWKEESPLGKLMCEALHDWCHPDCTMINSGVLLSALPKGSVTHYDIHRMLPHPINPCVIELSGAELKEVLFHAADPEAGWPELPVKGLGFRGKVMGSFLFHGVELDADSREACIKGSPILPGKSYRLGTIDMFTFGPFFPEIRRAPVKEYFMPEFLRDILQWKLKRQFGS